MISKRRVRFSLFVLASHLMLLALAVVWLVQMLVIAKYGAIRFVEHNPVILYLEIILACLVILFAIVLTIVQLFRLGEKRRSDERREEPTQER